MSNDTITFTCPACSITLTVPTGLAGITGPCPTCGATIQAPYRSQGPVQSSPLGPMAGPSSQVPAYAPISLPAVLPSSLPVTALPAYLSPPPLQAAAVADSSPSSPATPAALRPEPRQLPNRGDHHGEPVAKPMPEPNRDTQSTRVLLSRGRHSSARRRAISILVPLLLFLVTGVLIFGVLNFLNTKSKPTPPGKPLAPAASEGILSAEPRQSAASEHGQRRASSPLGQPTVVEPPSPPPEGIATVTPGMAAMEVLEQFLAAKTLDERLPLMETQTPHAELASSCLASALPMTSKIEIYAQETNAIEQVIDFYHHVDFILKGHPVSQQTVLVRSRGAGDPKVVVDPFLDTFGGRLAAYAKAPSGKAGTFQVIVSALASCNEEYVPNWEKKLTLKLLSRDNAKEITRAYFGRQSAIAERLNNGSYSLSYEKPRPCTVMLRWNTEDNPAMPYLEALTLKTLDWNP